VKFLVDAQLPVALARNLTQCGHDAIHVSDQMPTTTSDAVIWAFAVKHGCTLITKDEDFVTHIAASPPETPVIWVRLGNCRNAFLLEKMGAQLDKIIALIEDGGNKLIELG
jgi:predicted nuclease of predicted toxin-antitoxin system